MTNPSWSPIRRLPPNTAGRDFIIGDLHGSFGLLMKLLDHIQFERGVDRMISVGDLCDRGPSSLECLELLKEPWFHCVLSNHEQMLMEAFDGGPSGPYWIQNGGGWGIEALRFWHNADRNNPNELLRPPAPSNEAQRLIDMLPFVRELPLLITLEKSGGKLLHVLHAELPLKHFKVTDEILADPNRFLELATVQTNDGDHILWGRWLYYSFYNTDLSNEAKIKRKVAFTTKAAGFSHELSHIVSGHTIVRRPLTIGGQTNIDTGAYVANSSQAGNWEALTCIEVEPWKFHQVTLTEAREVAPLIVTVDDVASVIAGDSVK